MLDLQGLELAHGAVEAALQLFRPLGRLGGGRLVAALESAVVIAHGAAEPFVIARALPEAGRPSPGAIARPVPRGICTQLHAAGPARPGGPGSSSRRGTSTRGKPPPSSPRICALGGHRSRGNIRPASRVSKPIMKSKTTIGALVALAAIATANEPGRHAPKPTQVIGSSAFVTHPSAPGQRAPAPASTIWPAPGGVLVIDADSGLLARVDRAREQAVETLAIGADAGPMIVDGSRAYVVDRRRDRVVVVALDGALAVTAELPTRTEPVGLALIEGGKRLLVTSAADGRLSAIDVARGKERWSLEVGPEPRAVAVSPDGGKAIVTLLRASAVAEVDLAGEVHATRHVALDSAVTTPQTLSLIHI